MNTAHINHTDKLQKLIDSLGFSPRNQSLALEYLTDFSLDDSCLNRAEPQDFNRLGWKEQGEAVRWLAEVRSSRNPALFPRYIKLFWAIGRSTAIFLIASTRQTLDHSDLIPLVGKPAVAAMMAENFAWTNGQIGRAHV